MRILQTCTTFRGLSGFPLLRSTSTFSPQRLFSKRSSTCNKEKNTSWYDQWILNPNVLTVSRICLTPFIGYSILQGHYKLGLTAFCFAGITDFLDGYIARKYNKKTVMGTIIDPMADKILVGTMTLCLTQASLIPLPLAVVIIGRDACLGLAAFYYRWKSLPSHIPKTFVNFFDLTLPSAEVKPTLFSKINTTLQLSLITASLAIPAFNIELPLFLNLLQYSVAATTIISGFQYVMYRRTVIRIIKNDKH